MKIPCFAVASLSLLMATTASDAFQPVRIQSRHSLALRAQNNIHEFDYSKVHVVYDVNGVKITSFPAVHIYDGPVSLFESIATTLNHTFHFSISITDDESIGTSLT